MCFHSRQTKDQKQLERHYEARVRELDIFRKDAVYNGFTYPRTPVIANTDIRIIEHFQWGLIPSWAKDFTIQAYTLNAKIETILEKPSFKSCVKNRCLVIVDGFYEWQWLDPKGKKKQKYEITLPDNGLFSLAGIWSEWVDKSTGEIVKTYSIVTTEANELMAGIHNNKKRMPVVLSRDEESEWLGGADLNGFSDRSGIELKAAVVRGVRVKG